LTIDPPPQKDPLEIISRNVAVLGSVIALVAGGNTFLIGLAHDRVEKSTAFRQAVSAEEVYWKARYDDYLATFGGDLKDDARVAKRLAIYQLAQHTLPDFAEFDVPKATKTGAIAELTSIKTSLLAALASKEASGPAVSAALSEDDFKANEATTVRPVSGASAPSDPDAVTVARNAAAPTTTQLLTTTVLAVGRPQGWDIDVFWCRGPNESATYITASTAAASLAQLSTANTPIAPGVALGRIRLRPLPVEINSQLGYGLTGNVVRPEDRADEKTAAQALLRILNAAQPAAFTVSTAGSRTPWYISVFACAANASG
jgi:hypothetical protein